MLSFTLCFLVTLFGLSSASPKLWWQKPVEGLSVGGRPSIRQIKYLSEGGFKSIITLFNFTNPIPELDVPVSMEAERLSKSLGMEYDYVITSGMNFRTLEPPHKFGELYQTMPKPIYLHCFIGYSAFFTAYSYFANASRGDSEFKPRITVDELYRKALSLGWDFQNDPEGLPGLIDILAGKPTEPLGKLNMSLPAYNMQYWLPKPIYDNLYVAGQIQSDQLSFIKAAGFDTIINLREDREEVTLLNVKDNTGAERQRPENLKKNRIDVNKLNTYISAESRVNYEVRNRLEFGDDVGYSEAMEREAVKKAGLKYLHLPTSKFEISSSNVHPALFS